MDGSAVKESERTHGQSREMWLRAVNASPLNTSVDEEFAYGSGDLARVGLEREVAGV